MRIVSRSLAALAVVASTGCAGLDASGTGSAVGASDQETHSIHKEPIVAGNGAVIGNGANLPNGATLPNGVSLANGVLLPNGATLPNGAVLPNGATLTNGITLLNGATLTNGITFLNGAVLPNGTILPNGAVMANGVTFLNGAQLLNGASLPNGATLPNGAILANGTILGNGATLPNGTVLANGTILGNGAVLKNGVTFLNGVVLPNGTKLGNGAQLPNGTTLANGAVLSNGATLPNGAVLANGAILPNGAVLTNGVTLPNGAVFSNGAILPNGATLPNGAFLPAGGTGMVAGTTKSAGSTFASNTTLNNGAILGRGAVIGNGVTFPNGVTLPNGASFPNGTFLPKGTILPNGTFLPGGSILGSGTIVPNGTPAPAASCQNGVCNNGVNVAAGTIAPPAGSAFATYLSDPAKFKIIQYIFQCAMTSSQSISITVGSTTTTVAGVVGLAPNYRLTGLLDTIDQEWVSACLFARVNQQGNTVMIDMVSPHHSALASSSAGYTVWEAVTAGNLFVNPPRINYYVNNAEHPTPPRFCNTSSSCAPFTTTQCLQSDEYGTTQVKLESQIRMTTTTCGQSGNRYIMTFLPTGSCLPHTCASAGQVCGSRPDGCGGTLNCGTCSCGSGMTCNSVVQSVNAGGPLDKNFRLRRTGVADVTQALSVNQTLTQGQSYTYTAFVRDSVTGTDYAVTSAQWEGICSGVRGGSCTFTPAPGVANPPPLAAFNGVSACPAETDAQLCSRLAQNCGTLARTDRCGRVRSVNCGTCGTGLTCTTANTCAAP